MSTQPPLFDSSDGRSASERAIWTAPAGKARPEAVRARIVVATDGSALRNPSGPAGWCWYVDDSCWAAGGWPKQSNNVAELTAVLELLRAAPATVALEVRTDSRYVIGCLRDWLPGWKRRGWRKADGSAVLNRELIASIVELMEVRDVELTWVKGHAGVHLNEMADRGCTRVTAALDRGENFDAGPGWTLPLGAPS